MTEKKILLDLNEEEADIITLSLSARSTPLAKELIDKITALLKSDWDSERAAVKFLEGKYAHVVLVQSSDNLLRDATHLLAQDYREDVKGLANAIVDAIKDGEVTDDESFAQRLSEDVEGTQRVIYTNQAMAGVIVSDNAGYAFENGLINSKEFKDGIPWDKIMYWALYQDVIEELDHLGIDPNKPVLDPEEFAEWFLETELDHEDDKREAVTSNGESIRERVLDQPMPAEKIDEYLAAIVEMAKAELENE